MGRLAPPHTTPIPIPYVHMTSRMRRHRISGARRRMAATGTDKWSPIDTISRVPTRAHGARAAARGRARPGRIIGLWAGIGGHGRIEWSAGLDRLAARLIN